MNSELLKRTRFKLERNKKGFWTIKRKKGILWILPFSVILFFGIFESVKWAENFFLLSLQVIFLGIIPFVMILGFIHIVIYKLEINPDGISKRDFKFPLLIENKKWTEIENVEIQIIDAINEKKRSFNLLINSDGDNFVLLKFYAKNDEMTIKKMKQLGKDVAIIINKPLVA